MFYVTNPSATHEVVVREFRVSCEQPSRVRIELGRRYLDGGEVMDPVDVHRIDPKDSVLGEGAVYAGDLALDMGGELYGHLMASGYTTVTEATHITLGLEDTVSIHVQSDPMGPVYVTMKYDELKIEKTPVAGPLAGLLK